MVRADIEIIKALPFLTWASIVIAGLLSYGAAYNVTDGKLDEMTDEQLQAISQAHGQAGLN